MPYRATLPVRSKRGAVQIHNKRAQVCGDLIRELPYLRHIADKAALAEQLELQQRAEVSRRIAAQKQPTRFLQCCFLLDLW